jgi:hypothetical protein
MDAPEAMRAKAVAEEKNLMLWKRGSLDMIWDEWDKLSASEVSDLIRLYGCLVEQGKDMIPKLKEGTEARAKAEALLKEDKQKDLYRKGGGDRFPKGQRKVWDKQKFRRRGGAAPPPEWLESMIGPADESRRGISIKAALDDSVLGKIENTFGLWKGAAISGTTTDTIHALKRFGGADLDPLFFLLPVATIVWNYHHALVEVAMALTMNRIMDYSIGLYSTLMPRKASHPAKSSIESILRRFQDRGDNKLILIYYAGNKKAGCFQFEAAEDASFKRLALADISLWQRFSALKTYPSEADILQLIRQHGLEGKAMLAVRKQLHHL